VREDQELVAFDAVAFDDVDLNGAAGDARLPGNTHFTFRGCEGDALLMLLENNEASIGLSQPRRRLTMLASPLSSSSNS
jgi:cysteine sulfinate desulfinase/cysteine desulfurase-like protein